MAQSTNSIQDILERLHDKLETVRQLEQTLNDIPWSSLNRMTEEEEDRRDEILSVGDSRRQLIRIIHVLECITRLEIVEPNKFSEYYQDASGVYVIRTIEELFTVPGYSDQPIVFLTTDIDSFKIELAQLLILNEHLDDLKEIIQIVEEISPSIDTFSEGVVCMLKTLKNEI